MAPVNRRSLQPGERIRVLAVDDSAVIRRLVAHAVEQEPLIEFVGAASNGAIALQRIPQFNPHVLTLDVEMPEMDGLEFLRHAKLRTRAKIVILSSVAVAGSPHAAKARELGADAIVTKPSGAVSMDLADKRGSQLVQTMKTLIQG